MWREHSTVVPPVDLQMEKNWPHVSLTLWCGITEKYRPKTSKGWLTIQLVIHPFLFCLSAILMHNVYYSGCESLYMMLGIIQQGFLCNSVPLTWHVQTSLYMSFTYVLCAMLAHSAASACGTRLSVRCFTALMMMTCIGQDSCSTRTRMANTLTCHCVPSSGAALNQQESLWKSELRCIHLRTSMKDIFILRRICVLVDVPVYCPFVAA